MPIQDDPTIADNTVLYRVLVDKNWIAKTNDTYRPASVAFHQARGDISYFLWINPVSSPNSNECSLMTT